MVHQGEARVPAKKRPEQPILVPTDFSVPSETALVFASELAEALQCPLVVLHVVHDPGEAPGYFAVNGRDQQLRAIQDVAADMMTQFMHEMQEKYPEHAALRTAQSELVVGLPVTRILEMADKTDACMIVMGSQGRTGLAHILLGSKAEQVVRLAPKPVTIVKAPQE